MAKLFAREYSKKDLQSKLGSMDQLCGVTPIEPMPVWVSAFGPVNKEET